MFTSAPGRVVGIGDTWFIRVTPGAKNLII